MATTTKNDEAAAAAGVAVPVDSLDAYNAKVEEQVQAQPQFSTAAIDASDASTGWTAQSPKAYVAPEDVPGQVFLPEQLPDPAISIRAGLPVPKIPEYLVTEDEDHPSGPEPWETGSDPRDVREAVRARVIKDKQELDKAAADARADNTADTTTKKSSSTSSAKTSSSS